eukprot:GFUD01034266.1.p1 GENE.GFUD01034266.1~~GFUD01034266.1.p1  ORF type:complete len:565 (+),score=154.12 GFUD01034266.1:46-1740(+)
MKITVKDSMAMCGRGRGNIYLEVEPKDTIAAVKRKLQDCYGGIPAEYQELFSQDRKRLQDKKTLESYDIGQSHTIDLRYKHALDDTSSTTETVQPAMKRPREPSNSCDTFNLGENSSVVKEPGVKKVRLENFKNINQNQGQEANSREKWGGEEIKKNSAPSIPLRDLVGGVDLIKETFPSQDVFSHPSERFRTKLSPDPDDFLKIVDSLSCPVDMKKAVTGVGKWRALTTEIVSSFNNEQQEKVRMIQKVIFWKEIYRVLRLEIDCSIFVFGSTFNGFGGVDCDIDMCVFPKGPSIGDKQWLVTIKSLLARHCGHLIQTELELVSARVPVLKFKFSFGKSSLDVDLSVNNLTCVRNTHLLYCYSQLDYRVRPLVLAIKFWAKDHKINNARLNTLSSYTIALMVLSYLQCGVSPPVVPCLHKTHPHIFHPYSDIHSLKYITLPFSSLNTMSLGELLAGFFRYYADIKCFNPVKDVGSLRCGSVLSVSHCQLFAKQQNLIPRQWSAKLLMEEPFDRMNAASAVFDDHQWRLIMAKLEVAARRIKRADIAKLTLEDISSKRLKYMCQ